MSRPMIDEFTVRLDFEQDGTVSAIHYVDREGCGWEGDALEPVTPVSHLVGVHLRHCDKSHDMRPKIMCGFTIKADIGTAVKGAVLVCKNEKHDQYTPHRFEVGVTETKGSSI